MIAAEGEELESGLEEEMEGSDGSEEDVVCGTGAGVVMMEVRRTRDVIPLVEAVEERVMVFSWEVVVEGRLGTWFCVSGVVGDRVAACTEEESEILVVESEDRGGDGGLVLVVGGRSGNEVGLLLLLLLLLEPPDAAAGAPSLAIDAVGLPSGREKKRLSSLRLQQTLLTSRFWSQQYWPPWLEHCWTAWAPKSVLSF